MVKLIKPLQIQGFLNGRTATVSETVSNAESHSTIRHYLSELAETLPQRAFTHAVETGLVTRQRGGKLVRRPNPARRFEDQTQRRPGRLPRQQDLKFSLSIIPRSTTTSAASTPLLKISSDISVLETARESCSAPIIRL